VLMVNNPQMVDLQQLTAKNFTAETGINVNFTVLPENDVRDKISQEFSSQAGQYDVATVSNFEIPIYARSKWIAPLDDYVAADPDFDQADILKPLTASLSGDDGKLYGEPFYGESSFLMYRKDVLAQAGIQMPDKPTWQQVADIAAKVDGAQPGMAGICLRGQPGWGQVFAPLTTVVNTFGGTWFTKDWQAQVNSPQFTQAVQFYTDLIKKHGEPGAAQAGFTECLNALSQGKVGMWYDATSAAGSLEDPASSKVVGKIGYAYAPVEKTDYSGWLWSWNWAMPKTSKHADDAAKFALWATSKQYEQTVGEKLGWPRVPSGKRASTYELPEYKKASGDFGQLTLESIEHADPANPGLQPRPTLGIQYVTIPEFADLGTKVSQSISGVLAGKGSVKDALDSGQSAAEAVAKNYQ
jgi:sorbitol/mannitol transport system substrate-binding protein